MEIGEHARAARLAVRLSQGQVELMTGIKRSQISDIERGKHWPNIRTLIRMAEAYTLPVSVIIGEMPIPDEIIIKCSRAVMARRMGV